jgi:8-oxo-dGTP diphosphatase
MEKTLYVVGFAFDLVGENVVLIRKNKPKWQEGRLNGIGGKIELHEIPIDAMVREFKEETGVDSIPGYWINFAKMESDNFLMHCYKTFDDTIFHDAKTVESEEIVKIKVGDIKSYNTISNIPTLLAAALDFNDGNNPPFVSFHY